MFRELLQIIKEKVYEIVTSRLFLASVIFVILFGVLVGRLFYLQIVHGEDYYEKYVNITLTEVETSAPRGLIYDRNGTLLAWNEISYAVTIRDTGTYSDKARTLNPMILRLVCLLEDYNQDIKSFIPVIINEDGEYEFSGSQASIRLFIRDMYGKEAIEKKAAQGEDVYAYSAEEVMTFARDNRYGFTGWRKYDEEAVNALSKEHELKILNIRYALTGYSYRKYQSVTICSDVTEELCAAIMENSFVMDGVEISQETRRVYTDDPAFSHIIGYTGIIRDQEECDDLNAQAIENGYIEEGETMYSLGDYVGRTGIEKAMDAELQGQKGKVIMYLDNVGQILETVSEQEAVVGNDIYLSLDADLQTIAYHSLENNIADQLISMLSYEDNEVYYQLINNNIISVEQFEDENATDLEKQVLQRFEAFRLERIQLLVGTLRDKNGEIMENISEEMQAYVTYIYDSLVDAGAIYTSKIDTNSNECQLWKDKQISPYQYFYYLVRSGCVDTSLFNEQLKYMSSDEMYQSFVEYIEASIQEDSDFDKELYKYLIDTNTVTPNEICLLLFEQGVLEQSEVDIQQLQKGNSEDAYRFIVQKIQNLEITPAQLAMDPSSGACNVTDPNTGELLAMVSYPGYDLNKLSGTIDATYWKKLSTDLSKPMYNNATQTSIAPGSTFKIVTAAAALNEGYVGINEDVDCLGIYEFTGQKCWYYTEYQEGHGPLDIVGAIANSCNYYFYEMGRRFSLNEEGKMNEIKGLEVLSRYASAFGLDQKTGVEIGETQPRISNELPISSAIGQGTNSFASIQLSRYVTAIASKGNVYQYTLISKIVDSAGNVLQEYEPTIINKVELSDDIWNALHEGMAEVMRSGTVMGAYADISEQVAAKTGSAQQDLTRANHGQFISFAPYEDPQIAVNATINFGNGSTAATYTVKGIYYYCFGYRTYEELTTRTPEAVDYNSVIELPSEEVIGD